jgi:hypothetical protein
VIIGLGEVHAAISQATDTPSINRSVRTNRRVAVGVNATHSLTRDDDGPTFTAGTMTFQKDDPSGEVINLRY